MLEENDVPPQRFANGDPPVCARAVVLEASLAAGLCVVAGEGRCLAFRVHAFASLLEGAPAHVGRVDLRAIVEAFLREQDRRRVHLLAGGAPPVPYLELRIRA